MSLTKRISTGIGRLYRRVFRPREDAWAAEYADILRGTAIFAALPTRVLRALAGSMHERRYAPDELVYLEGDPGLGLYVVTSGAIRLEAEEADGSTTRQIGTGEVFGVLSIFGEFPRLASAYAVGDTKLFGLFRPDLASLVARNPSAGAAVVQALAYHLTERHLTLMDGLKSTASSTKMDSDTSSPPIRVGEITAA